MVTGVLQKFLCGVDNKLSVKVFQNFGFQVIPHSSQDLVTEELCQAALGDVLLFHEAYPLVVQQVNVVCGKHLGPFQNQEVCGGAVLESFQKF